MEDYTNLSAEEIEAHKAEKKRKSNNRIFGLLLIICLLLLVALIYEIYLLVQGTGADTSSSTASINIIKKLIK